MQNDSQLILRPSLGRSLALAAVCGAFSTIGVFMILDGEFMGWLAVAFFGFGTLMFLGQMLPNASYLKLDADGFTLRSLYRSKSYRWTDVSGFAVGRVGGNRGVVLNFSREYGKHGSARRFNAVVFGTEGALPDTYGLAPGELATLLNEWKARFAPATSLETAPVG